MSYGLKVSLEAEEGVVRVNVVDRDNKGEVMFTRDFDANRVHESLRMNVGLYGLSKLIQDRTSDKSVKDLGEGKLDAMEDVLARLETGEWSAERKVGAPTVSVEVEALAAFKGVSIASIQKALRAYTKDQKEIIFANDGVAAKVAEIKAAREAAEDVSLDGLI